MRKPGEQRPRRAKGVRFGGPVPALPDLPVARPSSSTSGATKGVQPLNAALGSLGSGWGVKRSVESALLQADQRAYGRALLRRFCGVHPRPWAVRGEVPYESENCKLCAMVVVGGVRMHLPEKLFGRSWFELHHEPSGICLTFDAMGALQSWAGLSVRTLDERRAGRTAWSGKSADRLDRANWQARWDSTATLQRREEYDWTYRTVYQGELHVRRRQANVESGDARGNTRQTARSAETVDYWESFRPVCLCTTTRTPSDKMDDSNGVIDGRCSIFSAGLVWKESQPQPHSSAMLGDVAEEVHTKLYEDYLHDLGIASLALRFRRHERGWEARLRWWAVVNPSCSPQRGLPHARLRDTTYRFIDGTDQLIRQQLEKELYLDDASLEIWKEGASLDADAMESVMHSVLPVSPTHSMRLLPQTGSMAGVQEAKEEGGEGQGKGEEAVEALAHRESTLASSGAMATGLRIADGTQGDEVLLLSSSLGITTVDPENPTADALSKNELLACAWLDTGRIWLFAGSTLLWEVPQAAPALESIAFYIPRGTVSHDGVARNCNSNAALLSCGVDGHIRAWTISSGTLWAEVRLQGAVGADSQIRGCCVVQRIAVEACAAVAVGDPGFKQEDSVQAQRIVAACGRSVFAIQLVLPDETPAVGQGTRSNAQLLAVGRRPALPSIVVDLAFALYEERREVGAGTDVAGGEWCCSLVVGTSTAGLFIWEGAAAVDDLSAPPSRCIHIGSSCVSLSVLSPLPHSGWAGEACLVANCSDRTLRMWSLTEIASGDVLAPMTFGGFSATERVGSDVSGGRFCVTGEAGWPEAAAEMLTVADGSGGLVCWLLPDPATETIGEQNAPSAPNAATRRRNELKARGSLGLESCRACRLCPGTTLTAQAAVVATLVLPQSSMQQSSVTAETTSGCLAQPPTCKKTGTRGVCATSTRTRIAYGDIDGGVHVLAAGSTVPEANGSAASLFADTCEDHLQLATGATSGGPGRGDPVAQLAAAGGWLYAATEGGAVVTWPIEY